MIEKIEQVIAVAKQFSSIEFMAKALIWLAVLVCLYEYDQDNLINFRQCLLRKEWISASLSMISLLLTLANWSIIILGILFSLCIIAKCLARGYVTAVKFFCYIMKISFTLNSCVLFIVVAHRVLLDNLIIHRLILPLGEHWKIWVPIFFCIGIYIIASIPFEEVLSKNRKASRSSDVN